MAPRNNRDILTKGQKYHEKSKSFKSKQVAEVLFDKSSRLDYLTGFHKRKLDRQKKAQEFNKEQERLMRIEERKRIKKEREEETAKQLEDFKKGMKDVGDYLGSDAENDDDEDVDVLPGSKDTDDESDDEWKGFEEEEESKKEDVTDDTETEEKEIAFEDPNATKSILKRKTVYEDATNVEVETLEPNDNFEFIAKLNNVRLEQSENILEESITRAQKYAKFMGMHDDDPENKKNKPKQKKKKFRYLTKVERKDNQRKAAQNKNRRK